MCLSLLFLFTLLSVKFAVYEFCNSKEETKQKSGQTSTSQRYFCKRHDSHARGALVFHNPLYRQSSGIYQFTLPLEV